MFQCTAAIQQQSPAAALQERASSLAVTGAAHVIMEGGVIQGIGAQVCTAHAAQLAVGGPCVNVGLATITALQAGHDDCMQVL